MEKLTPSPIREKSYLRIVGTIMDMIAQGKVQYGDRLYNEQELVAMLGVSRPTLREALRVLEFLGVATVVPHKGITISKPSQTGGYLPLLYILAFEKTTGRELFELRQALQLEMVALAAANRADEDVQVLQAMVEEMETNKLADADVLSQLDDDFHQKLLEISGNRLVCKLMETIRPMIRKQLEEHIQNETLAHRDQTIADHKRIAECVKQGDSAAARQAMYLHLTDSRRDADDSPVPFQK